MIEALKKDITRRKISVDFFEHRFREGIIIDRKNDKRRNRLYSLEK